MRIVKSGNCKTLKQIEELAGIILGNLNFGYTNMQTLHKKLFKFYYS